MKHFLILLIVAIVTLSIVFIIYRPDLMEGAWLWIVGLMGPVIVIARKGIEKIKNFYHSLEGSTNNTPDKKKQQK